MENNEKPKKIGAIIAKIIILIIAIPIFIIAITVFVKANKYPDKIPDIFGYKPMIVLSGSMETSIHIGDLVIVKVVDTNELKEGDIIAFRNETNTVTTHRIVDLVEKNGKIAYRTKGDNNNAQDFDLVEKDDIEGIYAFKIPKVGSALMFIKEPQSLVIILLVILVIGLIWLRMTDKKESK